MIAIKIPWHKSQLIKTNLLLAIITLVFASLCQWVNQHVTHFNGNAYVPPFTAYIFLFIILMYVGVVLMTSAHHYLANVLKRMAIVYCCLWLIAYLTDSVQFTPFPEIDPWLIWLDKALLFDTSQTLDWLFNYPFLVQVLMHCYAFLQVELLIFFGALIILDNPRTFEESLFLLLATALIGFAFYYFFPTVAPAGMIANPHFFQEQLDTSLKFNQIHHNLNPTTIEGGLIAMPSFHCIWALICQRYSRSWPLLWWSLLPINGLLIAACVLLGWHYLVDILAAIGIFFACIKISTHKSQALL